MTRVTGKNEIVRAALDCIAYQIADIVWAMEKSADMHIEELRVDGGATRNAYLMQFQSDLLNIPVHVPDAEELSGIGAAYAAGLSVSLYEDKVFQNIERISYTPDMTKIRGKRCIWGGEMLLKGPGAFDVTAIFTRNRERLRHSIYKPLLVSAIGRDSLPANERFGIAGFFKPAVSGKL